MNLLISVIRRFIYIVEKRLQYALSKRNIKNQTIVLAGNFNTDLVDFDKSKKLESFVDLISNFGMFSAINKTIRNTIKTET